MQDKDRPSDLQRLIRLLRGALQALGVEPDDARLEALGVFVYAAMSGPGRDYHGTEHVLQVAAGAEPVQTLAALFHDVVYIQADGRLPDRQSALLTDVVEHRADGMVLRPLSPESDRLRAILQALFDVKPGEMPRPFTGLNEFLSALLAARQLEPLLPLVTLVRIGACIEATIPFRGQDPSGRSPPEALYRRLANVNLRFGLGMQPTDLEDAIRQAVEVANRDVAVFAVEDTERFLDSSWKLLPESNPLLRRDIGYTIDGYQRGLTNMARSTHQLDANRIFPRFLNTPDEATWNLRTEAARRNIRLSARFLDAKLLAISVLAALATLTGGDAPVALFMGDLPTAGRPSQRLEDHLGVAGTPGQDVDAEVSRLLVEGRRYENGFDLKNSPLAAYIYNRVGDAGIKRIVRHLVYPMGFTHAKRLLKALPVDLLEDIVQACCKIADTRKKKLSGIMQQIVEK